MSKTRGFSLTHTENNSTRLPYSLFFIKSEEKNNSTEHEK